MRGNPAVTVRLPQSLIDRLDAEAGRRVVHRSLIVNAALTEWLVSHEEAELVVITTDPVDGDNK